MWKTMLLIEVEEKRKYYGWAFSPTHVPILSACDQKLLNDSLILYAQLDRFENDFSRYGIWCEFYTHRTEAGVQP